MKSIKITISLLAVFACIESYSQSASDYEALSDFLPAEKLNHLQSASDARYAHFAYINRHGYYLSQTDGLKDSSEWGNVFEVGKIYENAPDITLDMIQNQTLNMLAYKFKTHADKYSYYLIGNSNTLLVIKPTNFTLAELGQ